MQELIVDMFMSLDGYTADNAGGQGFLGPYGGPEFGAYVNRVLEEPQVMLLGRRTYELFADTWPTSTGPQAGAMNKHPKVVFSTTLSEPLTWSNARLAQHDTADEILALKREAGGPLRTIGSLTLVRSLMGAGLVDRLRLMVFPRILGPTGRHPMFRDHPDRRFARVGTTVLDANIVVLEYRPTR
jgi:dihydrofolate reductase